jgi:signal transduction histidine kinase
MQISVPDRHQPNVLLIDDQVLVAEMVEQMLHEQADIGFRHVSDAREALAAALVFKPTVVLVDLRMPLIDGFGVIREFRTHPSTQHVPMILLSSEEDAELKVRGFAEGANDYLVKWPHKLELVARIRYHSNAYSALRQRDEAFVSLHKSRQDLLARTQELAESQAALHNARKMEAIGKLTGGVAHDFNNVLQIISGNLQLLKLEAGGNPKTEARVAAAMEGVKRGGKLALQLLAFGRRQPLQPGAIDIGMLVRGLHELLRRSIGDLISVETIVADNLWHALVDPNQLENVILNLAINARDAMDGEGRLTIEVGNFVLNEQTSLAHPELDAGGYVLIAVSDTGSGMSPEVMKHAFEPFFTTKPTGEGHGMGLSMAYGFAKQSGGHIELVSELGHGTTIRLYLPRAAARPSTPQPAASRAAPGGNETVLVVEDEPAVRASTVEILAGLGYRTLEAEDAASALKIIEDGVDIDLLFTDVVMPGPLRSSDLAIKAKELLPRVEVLFASGYIDGGLLKEGRLTPGVSVLSKPYSGDELAQKIRQVLSARAEPKAVH